MKISLIKKSLKVLKRQITNLEKNCEPGECIWTSYNKGQEGRWLGGGRGKGGGKKGDKREKTLKHCVKKKKVGSKTHGMTPYRIWRDYPRIWIDIFHEITAGGQYTSGSMFSIIMFNVIQTHPKGQGDRASPSYLVIIKRERITGKGRHQETVVLCCGWQPKQLLGNSLPLLQTLKILRIGLQ